MEYLPFVFYGVANPKGEEITKNTTFFDGMQLKNLAKQMGYIHLPIHIEHVTRNNQTGMKVSPSGRTIAAKIDPETQGIGIYFILFNSPNGKYALDAMTTGTLTQGHLLQQLSIGYDVERLIKEPVALSNIVKEISIVLQGNREDTHIKACSSVKKGDNADNLVFDTLKKKEN